MKCIACGTDNNLKARTAAGGRCKKCLHRFAFEPTRMSGHPRFTDVFFQKAIAAISVNNTLSFTTQQFCYFMNRRLQWKQLQNLRIVFLFCLCIITFVIVIYAGSLNLSITQTVWFLALILVLCSSIALFLWLALKQYLKARSILSSVSLEQVHGWFHTWAGINGPVDRLLHVPTQHDVFLSSQPTTDTDITAYSFDRLVICQSDRIAQMLIANNFHFENACAILSVSGYPQRIFDTTLKMLRRNPALQVYTFHDCDYEGISLAHKMRNDPQWFPDEGITIVDIGLLPRQILAAKSNIFVQEDKTAINVTKRLEPAVRKGLSEAERRWLDAGNFVELESFTPKKLIRVLQQGIARSQQISSEGDSLLLLNETSGGGLLYTVDSFG